jgi:hypothetical protein
MAFSANTLADGVGRCALYLQYGEVNARKCMSVFRALQEQQIVTPHIRCCHMRSFGTDCPWRFKVHGRSDPRNASQSDPGLRVQKREDAHENGADKPGNKSQSSLMMQRNLHFQSLPKVLVGALLVAGF